MFLVHTVAPVVSSIAITSLPVVTAKNRPLPPALAGARYNGEAHMLPVNLAPVLNVASAAIVAAAALVNLGCTNMPSRDGPLFRVSTESPCVVGGAPPLPPAGALPPDPAVELLPAVLGPEPPVAGPAPPVLEFEPPAPGPEPPALGLLPPVLTG